MKKVLYLLGMVMLVFFVLSSCGTRENNNYMQNIDKIATAEALKSNNYLQSGDQLVINILAKDLDILKPFNQNFSSGQTLQNSSITGNVNQNSVTASGPTYIIDNNEEIDFPVVGKLSTKGLTLEDFRDNLANKLKRYIKNPIVTVRLNNFRVSVMGEVRRPGEYLIQDGKATIFNALSLAGDLTEFGVRNNVLVIRTVDGKLEKSRIDLTDASFFTSPYYNMKQGDVIYVSASETKQRTAKVDPYLGVYIAAAGLVVTILALVFKK
ncbi:polysaccharide biosynthesis/export family protein [Chryseobacterium sp. TY4]